MEEDAELEDTQELHTTMKWFSFTPEVAAELQHKYSQEDIYMTDTQGGECQSTDRPLRRCIYICHSDGG